MNKKVLILGLDGLRADCKIAAKTPNLDALAANGAYSWHAQTEIHTISGPAWTALLTGVHTEKHNVYDNNFKPRDMHYETLFKYLKRLNPKLRAVGNSHWKPILTEIFEKGVLNEKFSGSDKRVAYRTAQDIKKDRGDLYFVQFDEIDGAGHSFEYGTHSPKYLAKIEEIDGFIGEILAAVRNRPADEDWLICAVSDHGGEGKSHGMCTMGALTIIFIVSGNGVLQKGEISGTEDNAPMIVDIVPTIAYFLGVDPQATWDGQIRGF
jgi:predicted AlkP superfamily pyrophosphatase or phosphodiesterase